MPLEGRMVGPYRILERVGGGGMGVVHKAHDDRLDRTVAIKFLQPHLGADERAAERFRLEARTAGSLEHQNVCTVHEIGSTPDGTLFLVMPLYAGMTLQERIARGPLPVDEALAIAVQVARGLGKAHARGIVHRDIKPTNILITEDGMVKLLDFGIAKLVDFTLTGTAAPPGTVAYMSPEQALGGRVDHRTDLWSLGVVLYEMLAGERPYANGFAAATADAKQAGSPSLVVRRVDVPAALNRVVARAIARSPDDRYQSALEFEQELLDLGLAGDIAGRYTPRTIASARSRANTNVLRLVMGAAAVAVLGASAVLWLRPGPFNRTAAVVSAPATLAVLPFVDRSPDPGQEHFGDGITEELIATLSRVEGLRVASSTSVFAHRNSAEDVRAIGARLRVGTVLEGSVRRAGDRLRITTRLVSVGDGYQLWSESYDRNAGDAFAIQEEIALAIAQALQVRLVGAAADTTSRRRPDPEAYELYLMGQSARMKARFDRTSSTGEASLIQIGFYEKAIARDSSFAPAYVALAEQLLSLGFFELLPPAEVFPRAEAAARRAIELDPTIGEPHNALGYVELYYRWNPARAEESFRRAVESAPRHAVAHQWYGNMLTISGRFPEAVASMRRTQELDPTSVIAVGVEGWVLYYARDYAAALPPLRRSIQRNPEYAIVHLWYGWVLERMDSIPSAIAAHRKAVTLSDSGAVYIAALAYSLARGNDGAEAEALLRRLDARRARGEHVPLYEIAKVHAALGQHDEAFLWLERAFTRRVHSMALMRVDPQLDPLRSDPRLASLLDRVFAN